MIRWDSLRIAGARRSSDDWPQGVPQPLVIDHFLDRTPADMILTELERSSLWRRLWQISEPGTDGEIRTVDEDTFRATPTRISDDTSFWFSAVEVIGADDLSAMPACAALLTALNTPEFSAAMSETIGCAVQPASAVNAARYRAGDFLRAHQDTYRGWVGSLIVYLSRKPWSEGDGGRLGFRGPGGIRYTLPTHNSACMIPIDEANSHWVEPVTSKTFSRLSFNLHFGKA